jgi:four helix bundle protein
MCFVTDIYKASQNFPKEEQFDLASQIRRAAISIPSNISDGYGRESIKDYLRFLNMAMASLFELQTQLEISYNLKYL